MLSSLYDIKISANTFTQKFSHLSTPSIFNNDLSCVILSTPQSFGKIIQQDIQATANSRAANGRRTMGSNKLNGELPRRALGRTGVEVSALALGGSHLAEAKSERESQRIVHEAIDAGLNFMDNAWEYHDGRSEEVMGRALVGRRQQVFLMSKVCTHGRDKKTAMRQLEQSLKRLKTDHLDLWQIHEVIHDNDPDLHFARGGVIEALEQAKREGKVRFVGFTGHKDPAIHLKMLSHDFPFDTVQMPLNCFDATFRSFEQQVLPELQRRGIAPLGMKSMGGEGDAIKRRVVTPTEALRYAMSLPVAATVSGIDSLKVLHQNLRIATNFEPMTADEMQALRTRCAHDAADGHFELYKTSKKFDGPPGRKQHKFPSQEELAA
jgi:aryl-alcohol dehydrogenase-like predicted oxidoreductase